MSDKPQLTIAIPSFNNFTQLKDCLVTLTKYVEFPFKIIVINNGDELDNSGVPFEKALRSHVSYPQLEIIRPGENLGWQRSINKVFLEHCDTEYFAMFNDDLVFIPYHQTFLRQLMSYFRYTEVGAIGPSTNYVMGAQNIWFHQFPQCFETGLLIGFCLIVRSSVFSEVGGLDEGLIGGDDLDLSINIRKAGLKLLVDRSCYVHHIGAQTGPRVTGTYWNSTDHVDVSNNTLIRKHGVKWWYETILPKIDLFKPVSQYTDAEGDVIRKWVKGLPTGIDIGCGQNKTIENSVGIDKDAPGEVGLAGGRKHGVCEADMVGEATALPMEDSSQDYIVARHVFEHLIDPIAALDEWRRILKPGGTLAIVCPDQNRCNSMVMDFTHLHAYTPKSLEKLLYRNGFWPLDTVLIDPGYSFVIKATVGVSSPFVIESMKEREQYAQV